MSKVNPDGCTLRGGERYLTMTATQTFRARESHGQALGNLASLPHWPSYCGTPSFLAASRCVGICMRWPGTPQTETSWLQACGIWNPTFPRAIPSSPNNARSQAESRAPLLPSSFTVKTDLALSAPRPSRLTDEAANDRTPSSYDQPPHAEHRLQRRYHSLPPLSPRPTTPVESISIWLPFRRDTS